MGIMILVYLGFIYMHNSFQNLKSSIYVSLFLTLVFLSSGCTSQSNTRDPKVKMNKNNYQVLLKVNSCISHYTNTALDKDDIY